LKLFTRENHDVRQPLSILQQWDLDDKGDLAIDLIGNSNQAGQDLRDE